MVSIKISAVLLIKKIFTQIKNLKKIKSFIQNKKSYKNSAIKVPFILKPFTFIRENGGTITKSYKNFLKIEKYNKSENKKIFYNDIKTWDYKAAMENRYIKNLKFLEDYFIPLLKPDDILCDIGCASGQYTFMMAKHCKYIDGYDMSQNLIDDANEKAKNNNISNVFFHQSRCETIKFDKIYDNMSFMGVLCYVMDDKIAEQTIENLSKGLKKGGYLIYKDNSNNTNGHYYFFGPDENYFMLARSKKKLIKLFQKKGFKIIKEDLFDTVEYKNNKHKKIPLKTDSIGMILQKI